MWCQQFYKLAPLPKASEGAGLLLFSLMGLRSFDRFDVQFKPLKQFNPLKLLKQFKLFKPIKLIIHMKSTRPIILFLFLISFLGKNTAQTVDLKLAAALQHTLDSMRAVLNVKSLSAAVQLPDGATWAGAKGISSTSPLDSASVDHVYGIGSVTKTITAGCILQLADEGLLTLNDPLHLWLDTFQYINANITIRQLLRHQSGIYDVITDPDYQPAMWANFDSIYNMSDIIHEFIHPPLFQPGAGWSYSNTNYLLLGLIIEKATGNTYYHEFRERFFTPLGMDKTAIIPFEQLAPNVAHLWLDLDGDGVTDDAHDLFIGWNSFNSSAGPAGSYYCTAAEMAVWMRAYMGGSLLSQAMMDEMMTTVNTVFPGGTKYGLGVMERNFLGIKGFGHGGDAGYSASVFYFPEKDISIAVLNNDSKNSSWTLAPVISELLRTYIECESQVNAAHEIGNIEVELSVYPNPFSQEINVSFKTPPQQNGEVQFVLTDVSGKIWATTERAHLPPNGQPLQLGQLGNLPPGSYFLQSILNKKQLGTVQIRKGN